jgi:ribosomal protein S18 acetylase RimI-like enzyme
MINATLKDRDLVIDILSRSFDTNKSVNYIIPQDSRRSTRIRKLMGYSFDVCFLFGEVVLSNDRNACALILFPDQKKTTAKSIMLDANFAISCIGLSKVRDVLAREAKIRQYHPNKPFAYLWFIGVDPQYHNKGIGSQLLAEVIDDCASRQRELYLETSTLKNIPWYQKHGFKVFNVLDLSYDLHFLKRELQL